MFLASSLKHRLICIENISELNQEFLKEFSIDDISSYSKFFLTTNQNFTKFNNTKNRKVLVVDDGRFSSIINDLFRVQILQSISGSKKQNKTSAIISKVKSFKWVFLLFISTFLVVSVSNQLLRNLVVNFLSFFYLLYLINLLFRVVCFLRLFWEEILNKLKRKTIYNVEIDDLDTVTIVCCLYKESTVIAQLIKSISRVDYPKDNIKYFIVIEDGDDLTKNSLNSIDLPSNLLILTVPNGEPRTKGRALNYALLFTDTKYIGCFDAEDIPSADQVRKSLISLNLDPKIAATQCGLSYYNHNYNILTTLFNLEYILWFSYVLRGCSLLKMNIPLGGSSNFFKTDIIKKIGGWDANNVTEDLELAVRLTSYGYKINFTNSETLEESPHRVMDWMRQRTRWIKGYIKTYVDYLFDFTSTRNIKNSGISNKIMFHLIVGFNAIAFIFFPLILYDTIKIIYNGEFLEVLESVIDVQKKPYFKAILNKNWSFVLYKLSLYLSSLIFFLMAIFVIFIAFIRKYNLIRILISIFIYPFYFILHSIATYRAVWHLFTKPEYLWEKTPHSQVMR